MTYINFITGLIIAAVLSVPGAMQHEATQVGEELVVEKELLSPQWFEYDLSAGMPDGSSALQSGNYIPRGTIKPCDGESSYCGVFVETGLDGLPDFTSDISASNAINQYFHPTNPVVDPTLISERD